MVELVYLRIYEYQNIKLRVEPGLIYVCCHTQSANTWLYMFIVWIIKRQFTCAFSLYNYMYSLRKGNRATWKYFYLLREKISFIRFIYLVIAIKDLMITRSFFLIARYFLWPYSSFVILVNQCWFEMVIIVFNFLPYLQMCPTSFIILSRRIFRRSVQCLWLHNKVHHFYLWVPYLLWCYVYICSSFLYKLYTKKKYVEYLSMDSSFFFLKI